MWDNNILAKLKVISPSRARSWINKLVGPGTTFFSTDQMIGLGLGLSMFDRIVVPGLTKDLISGTHPTLLNSGHNLDLDYSLILPQ